MAQATCSVDGCEAVMIARGWCHRHYKRWQTHGDPLVVQGFRSDADRFWSKVDRSGACWLWTGLKLPHGYGRFGIGGRADHRDVLAHRFAYELLVGPIPGGLQIDHLCRVRACVNPAHMEPVTGAENTRRGGNAAKTHCKRGHEFSTANTYTRHDGRRQCRACHREEMRVA